MLVIFVLLIGLLSSSLRFSATAKATAVAASRQITNTVGASLVKALDLRDSRFPDRRALPRGGAALRARLAPLSAFLPAARVANTVPPAYRRSATRQETESHWIGP